jgi:DNA-binding GntR family transcriptional regulator
MKKHTAQTLELPERRSLASVIFEELERMILSGALKPGQAINEKALSDNNGLSRGPIREACRRLEQAGLIEIIVNRGAFVRRISRRSAAELCDIRVLLAGYAGRLAASRVTDEQIAALTDLMKMIEAEIEAGNLTEFYRLNYDFHMTIIEASGNRRLADLYAAINKELNLFRWRALKGGAELAEAATAHRSIVAALQARDADALVAAMEEHLRAANERLMQSVDEE